MPGAAEQVGLKVWPFTRTGSGVIWTHPSACGAPAAEVAGAAAAGGAARAGVAMPASAAEAKAAAIGADQGRSRDNRREGAIGEGREGERTVPPGQGSGQRKR